MDKLWRKSCVFVAEHLLSQTYPPNLILAWISRCRCSTVRSRTVLDSIRCRRNDRFHEIDARLPCWNRSKAFITSASVKAEIRRPKHKDSSLYSGVCMVDLHEVDIAKKNLIAREEWTACFHPIVPSRVFPTERGTLFPLLIRHFLRV